VKKSCQTAETQPYFLRK